VGSPLWQREEPPRGAVVIALAERREQKQRVEFRQQLHERFDRWVDTLEAQMKEPKPTLEQMTRAVREVRQELTGGLAEALVEQRYRAEQAQRRAPCPQCGPLRLPANGLRSWRASRVRATGGHRGKHALKFLSTCRSEGAAALPRACADGRGLLRCRTRSRHSG
jgi:hypothetical protein